MNINEALFDRHLEEDEAVIVVLHKHWLIGITYLFWPTALFVFLSVFLAMAFSEVILYIVAAAAVLTVVWWFRNFFDYYLDAWIITTFGIIDVEWHGWFHRQSSRVLYSDIQGVSYEFEGVFQTLLKYGTISVEKISTGTQISMENVPNPRAVEAIILKSMERYLHSNNLKDASTVQELLSTVIARELKLREFEEDDEDSR